MAENIFWGDLHSHCSISYGHGTLRQALLRAREQLDFCSVTGHAFWPDMPTDQARYGEIIDYHREGFATLAGNWDELIRTQATASQDGSFIALPSYEWHSLRYGDHNVYGRGPDLPLVNAPDLPALQAMARGSGAIVVPHHIGYSAGYRGIDWRNFAGDVSPVVEIFSLHGCSESDDAPYPHLHDMGPRDAASTAAAGWAAGHRFGVFGSTDHHAAYPGSHGDGRMAVLAERLGRAAIWDAILARRVYAVTGDKIEATMHVEDAPIGSAIRASGTRHLRIHLTASDSLDRVEVLKNGAVLRRFFPEGRSDPSPDDVYRLRITWGWGRKDEPVRWDAAASLSAGRIHRVESCFSGQTVVAPKGVGGHTTAEDADDLPHKIIEQDDRHCCWRSVTMGNPSTRQASTQAVSLEIAAPLDATVSIEANSKCYTHALGQLLAGGRSHFLRGWLSEAIRIGPLVPRSARTVLAEFDDEPDRRVDVYRLRAAQKNNQWAWLTPIWVER